MRPTIAFHYLLDAFVRDYPHDRNEHAKRNGNPWHEECQRDSCHINNERDQDNRVVALIDVEGTLRTNKAFTLTAYAIGVPTYSSGELFFESDKIEVQKFAYEGSTPTDLFSRFAKRHVSDDKARQLVEDKAR
jgi:hypothetical protein